MLFFLFQKVKLSLTHGKFKMMDCIRSFNDFLKDNSSVFLFHLTIHLSVCLSVPSIIRKLPHTVGEINMEGFSSVASLKPLFTSYSAFLVYWKSFCSVKVNLSSEYSWMEPQSSSFFFIWGWAIEIICEKNVIRKTN